MRVRWALEEVGQAYDVRYLNWGEQKEPAHRARNPFGQVPAYEVDGLTLFESGAIVLHIAERWLGLWPTDPDGRARAIEWIFAALNTVEPVSCTTIAKVIEGKESWAKAVADVLERLAKAGDCRMSRHAGRSVSGRDLFAFLRHVGDPILAVIRPAAMSRAARRGPLSPARSKR